MAAAIAELKAMGVSALMLTGDNARTAAAIAGSLGLDHKAELMPDDKVAAIREAARSAPVMMVGDGINDAPALAAASIGVAMGSGTDVALETADGAILKSRVRDAGDDPPGAGDDGQYPDANIAIALGLKAVFLVTSVPGYTGLWVAISAADTGATVIVTANALRLLRFSTRAGRVERRPQSLRAFDSENSSRAPLCGSKGELTTTGLATPSARCRSSVRNRRTPAPTDMKLWSRLPPESL